MFQQIVFRSSIRRFDLEYIGEDGKAHRPVVIHRAILGSSDRFISFLLEETKGMLPLWVAPVQVKILPITDNQRDYALKLKEVFGLDDVNDLPIIYNIAWYEQKAVIVLLALLYLGVKNIHLGPTLPAFLSPNVANVLVNNFGIAGIDTVENDIKKFFQN